VHNEKRQSFGNASIIDPWGSVIAKVADGVGLAVAEIDLDRLSRIRKSMPILNHRRKELSKFTIDSHCTESKISSNNLSSL
jgi:predicted amidohydrolase